MVASGLVLEDDQFGLLADGVPGNAVSIQLGGPFSD